MKKRNQRLLFGITAAAIFMAPADLWLVYLEIPQSMRIVLMSVLGWMMGMEVKKWLDKYDDED